MNKKIAIYILISIIPIISSYFVGVKRSKYIDSITKYNSNEFSRIYKLNYANSNNDYQITNDFSEKDILSDLATPKYKEIILTSLILNKRFELANKYALKILEQEYDDLSLITVFYTHIKNNNTNDIAKTLSNLNIKKNNKVYKMISSFLKSKNNGEKFILDGFVKKTDELKFKAMIEDLNGNNEKALELYSKTLKEKFSISVFEWKMSLLHRMGKSPDVKKELNALKKDGVSFLYKEYANKFIPAGVITWDVIGAEMIFSNFFNNEVVGVPSSYLAYDLNKNLDFYILYITSVLNIEKQYDLVEFIIKNNINNVKLKDILRIQIADNNILQNKNISKSISIYKNIIKKYPENINSYIGLASIYEKNEKYKKAINLYDDIIKKLDDRGVSSWLLFFNRGIIFDKIGEWDLAKKDFEATLKLNQSNPVVLNHIGYSWLIRGENENLALNMIQLSVKSDPFNSIYIDSLGWGLYKNGDVKNALKYLEPAKMINTKNPVINYHLGVVYDEVGRKIEAKYQYKKAIRYNEINKELKDEELDDIQNRLAI